MTEAKTTNQVLLRLGRFVGSYRGVFADGGDTIAGLWQLCEDDVQWNDDLAIGCRRSV